MRGREHGVGGDATLPPSPAHISNTWRIDSAGREAERADAREKRAMSRSPCSCPPSRTRLPDVAGLDVGRAGGRGWAAPAGALSGLWTANAGFPSL